MNNSNKEFVNAVYRIMFEYLSMDELKNLILRKKGDVKYNILMRCAKYIKSLEIFQMLIEIAKSLLTKTEFIIWLKDRDNDGKSVLNYALNNNNNEILAEILGILHDNLSEVEFNSILSNLNNNNFDYIITMLNQFNLLLNSSHVRTFF